jgi:hypothetical protein
MAGYSGTPLAQKLGIKPWHTIALVDDPGTVTLELPAGVRIRRRLGGGPVDLVVMFVVRRERLERCIGP